MSRLLTGTVCVTDRRTHTHTLNVNVFKSMSIVKSFVCNVFLVLCQTPLGLAVAIGVGLWGS